MADANTTDSTPTTTPADASQATDSPTPPSTTATEAPPSADDAAPADDGAPQSSTGETLLTPKADDDAAPALSAEEQAAADARAALFGVPDGDYEVVGLPEGTVVDAEALAAVAPVARELGLSNEGLSKIAGVYAEKVLPQVTEQVTNQILAQSAQTTAGWATEATELVKTDPAFGGKTMSDVQAVAAKALDRFGGADFRQYLADTGLGNHPAMLKTMFLAGNAIAEDTTFERGGVVTAPKSRADKFYGTTS